MSDALLDLQRLDTTSQQLTHKRANLEQRQALSDAQADQARRHEEPPRDDAEHREADDAHGAAEALGGELSQTERAQRLPLPEEDDRDQYEREGPVDALSRQVAPDDVARQQL